MLSIESRAFCLEGELPGELKDARIERAVNLRKIGVVDIKAVRHREVGVIEHVESIESQFEAKLFFEGELLDQRHVHIPIAGPVDRSQTKVTDSTCGRVREERRTRATITRNHAGIDQQRKSRCRAVENSRVTLQLRYGLRCVGRVVTRAACPIQGAAC